SSQPTLLIYTLSLHDALPIFGDVHETLAAIVFVDAVDDLEENLLVGHDVGKPIGAEQHAVALVELEVVEVAAHLGLGAHGTGDEDRKSTRLNSSHVSISYAVF